MSGSKKNFSSQMNDFRTNLIQIKKDYNKNVSKLVDDSWNIFEQGCKELFKKHKNLKSFGWVQYTPMWEDDESLCAKTFAAYVDEPLINEQDVYEVYENDAVLSVAADDVIDFLTMFHDEVLQKMFGDQISVCVTDSGVKIQKHEIYEISDCYEDDYDCEYDYENDENYTEKELENSQKFNYKTQKEDSKNNDKRNKKNDNKNNGNKNKNKNKKGDVDK